MRFVTIELIALAALLAVAVAPAGADMWTVDPGGGGDYTTIQAAISGAAAGDIISVAAGTYAESINVSKAVTVSGVAGRAATILGGTASLGDGATVRGFTIGTASQGAFISGDGATFDDCLIQTTGAATTHTIQIYPGSGARDVTISNSTIKANSPGKAAIYVETFGILDGFTLDNNEIVGDYGITQSFGALNTIISSNTLTGIAGSTKRGIQIKTPMTNVSITNNEITGFAIGVRLDNNFADLGAGPVWISGNQMWDNTEENIKIKRAPSLSIAWNKLSQSTTAPNIHVYGDYADLDIAGISNNDMVGPVGMISAGPVVVDATMNWWGHPTGPYDNKSLPGIPNYNNPGGQGSAVSEYVEYVDWRTTAIPEPATLSLLGLGALVLARRRHRRR